MVAATPITSVYVGDMYTIPCVRFVAVGSACLQTETAGRSAHPKSLKLDCDLEI